MMRQSEPDNTVLFNFTDNNTVGMERSVKLALQNGDFYFNGIFVFSPEFNGLEHTLFVSKDHLFRS